MKLLIYEWKAYLEEDVLAICREKKISYDTFSWFFKDKNRDEEFVRWLDKSIDIRAYDAAGYAYDDDSEQCITEKRIL